MSVWYNVRRMSEQLRLPKGILILRVTLSCSGQFSIRPDKKSEPKVRKFKHVGMIAGGTG